MPQGNAKVARTFRLPPPLSEAINQRARSRGVDATAACVELLERGIEAPERNGAGPGVADQLLGRLERVRPVPLWDGELAQTVPDDQQRRAALADLEERGAVRSRTQWKAVGGQREGTSA